MVVESRRRLDDLLPYSPEDKVPDTPMLDLTTDNDEQPPQSPHLPPAETAGPSDGRVASPAGNSPNETRITSLGAKRSASEISGGHGQGGPSRNHQRVSQSPAHSKTVATMSINGHERRISQNELRAICLQPPPLIQTELYQVYSVLVQIVQAAADEFNVVDPHDFIEALSWSESPEAGDVEIIRRLRGEALTAGGKHKKLVVVFSHDADMFLATVDLDNKICRVLDPRTREEVQSREKKDKRDLLVCVWLFTRTLFPREWPWVSSWSISLDFAVPLSTPIKQPGVVSDHYLDDHGVTLELPTVVPFFYEMLRIVVGVETQMAYSDVMLLKRLFAVFEYSLILDPTRLLYDLRQKSDDILRYILDEQMRKTLSKWDVEFRNAVAGTREGSGRHCSPGRLLNIKLAARERLRIDVTKSRSLAINLVAQHAQISFILECMIQRCLRAKIALHYGIIDNVAAAWFFSVDASEQVLRPDLVLNRWKIKGLNDLLRKLQAMRMELDRWLEQCNQHFESVGI